MTPRVTPPFRADHVGSLLRPPALRRAREDFAKSLISGEELGTAEDAAIREVVELQRAAGLRSATDGEFRRASWHMDFIHRLRGIGKSERKLRVTFHNADGDVEFTPAGLEVTGKIGLDDVVFGEHFAFLKSIVDPSVTPKQTIPSPSMVYYRGGRAAVDETVYPDLEEFYEDLAKAYAEEIAGLAALGCTYLQLDDTSLAYLNDPEQRAMVARMGGDPDKQHVRNIATMNAALRGRPAGVRVTTHLCRGNFRSSWVAEGGYDFVADALFSELDVDGYFLEFDDERSGGFEPLRLVPEGKYVVLGLVTTKRGELESVDSLRRRIDKAARYVDLGQLCLSPQCGFSSTEEGNDLTLDEQKAKLERVVETAALVWG
ncbi:5-methyltetrahydropteroyltriglutamate--homocysteine S-methyltransferase [Amycolatopsis sp. NPDC059021]|uniref:5-methyltetrahydropteroyltriglutamate-- homocysteine S-methyltransferase n=1 Tax=Amycolatopsis sp. NPDC059021 TaxID=3346704 RepID=UPI00366EFA8F